MKCTFCGRIQKGSLKTDMAGGQRFLVLYLNSHGRIRTDIGQGKQIRGTNEEIPIKGVQGKTRKILNNCDYTINEITS